MRPETLHIQPDLAGPYSTIPFILRPHVGTSPQSAVRGWHPRPSWSLRRAGSTCMPSSLFCIKYHHHSRAVLFLQCDVWQVGKEVSKGSTQCTLKFCLVLIAQLLNQ